MARLLLQSWFVFCLSLSMGDAVQPWDLTEMMTMPAAVPWMLPGLGSSVDAVDVRCKGESSRGPVLVTLFLQKIWENSNKITNRLRYMVWLSCKNCLA